jgi:RNA-binding protein 39
MSDAEKEPKKEAEEPKQEDPQEGNKGDKEDKEEESAKPFVHPDRLNMVPQGDGDDNDKDRDGKDKDKDKDRDEKERKRKRRSRSRSRERKSKKKKRSRSRSRERSRRGRRSDRDKDKDKDRDRDRERKSSRSKERSRRSSKDRERRRSRSRTPKKEKTPEELEAEAKRKAEEMEREANRDQYTCFVSQIHPKVDERDLFEFFSHVGRVEDIRLIRDQRTQKSKGLCYVEFWERDSVVKAVALTGQLIGGYPITVQITQTDLQKKAVKPEDAAKGPPMRLYVSQLHANVSENDLKPVFEAFGPVEGIELHKDPVSQQSKGFGFVTYKHTMDAKAAMEALDGLEIAGKQIKVGMADGDGNTSVGNMDSIDGDGDSGLAMTAQARAQLMQRLQRGDAMGFPQANAAPTPAPVPSTVCVLVRNMFDPKTEEEADFDLDIKEDVEEECAKYGTLKHIFVDKNSLGNVYLRFTGNAGAEGIVKSFHGRWFASRQIAAGYMEVATYDRKFPDSGK